MHRDEQVSATATNFASAAASKDFWRRVVRPLSIVTTIGMFPVLVMGFLDTITGSALGCGRSWPLCHGQFFPSPLTPQTAIEFGHRIGVPIETLLIGMLFLGTLWLYRDRLEIRILAPTMVLAVVAQAVLGAFVVIYPSWTQSMIIPALHYGISFISFVSILLVAAHVYGLGRWDRLRDRPLPVRFRWLVWGMTAYTYMVVYLGAYVSHMGAALGCTEWPLCQNGSLLPSANITSQVVFIHRVAAALLIAGIVWLAWWANRLRRARPDMLVGALIAVFLVLVQAMDGAFIVFSGSSVASRVVHPASIVLLFASMSYLVFQTLPRQRSARSLLTPAAMARSNESTQQEVLPAQS
jgi:cytochrome c oxidase assembly protein subunit 15